MPRLPRRLRPAHLRDALLRRTGASTGAPTGSSSGRDTDAESRAARDRRVVDQIRGLLNAGQAPLAASRSAAMKQEPETAELGALCAGIVASYRGLPELARHEFAGVSAELWPRLAASEFVKTGLSQDRAATLQQVRTLVEARPPLRPRRWLNVLEPVFGAGDTELARQILDVVDDEAARRPLPPATAVRHEWLQRWVARTESSPTAPATQDVRFAILDYDHPGRGRASANIGDHVQTVASLGHLVRHRGVDFDGPEDLVGLLDQLAGRVREDKALSGAPTRVQVLTADRDATRYNPIPENTWTLAFGWYMHALFGVRYGFPFHPNLLPIFVSFHCNKREMLTEDAIDYLREHGPIGCRDWTTVDILLSVDVPAFFSGCMTTTIGTLFEDLVEPPPADGPVAYVDIPGDLPEDAVTYKHSSDEVRFRSFPDNVWEAVQRLETYRTRHPSVVTSRLHAYLPLRAIGTAVDFQPGNRSDIRFAGLIGIDDAAFEAIRTGINDKLAQVVTEILAGAKPDRVYDLWRELNRDDLELARRRHDAPHALPAVPAGVQAAVQRAVDATSTRPGRAPGSDERDVVHVVVPLHEAGDPLTVLVQSLARHTTRHLHVWLLARGEVAPDLGALTDAVPDVTVSVVPAHDLTDGVGLGDDRSAAVRSPRLELLLLPRLLPDVDRAIVLPKQALVTRDIAELWDLDLEGHPFAAPSVLGVGGASGFGVVHNAGNRLGPRTDLSTELRRLAHARHVFDFTAFDLDVLVVDLDRMRAEDLADSAVGVVAEFGLSARSALHVVTGPGRAVVPEAWSVDPVRQHVDDPALLHWRDPVKPWSDEYAPLQERWLAERARGRQAT